MRRKQQQPAPMIDWFGNPIEIPTKAPVEGNPCVALYGAGPEGVTCQDCVHLRSHRQAKVYYKCDLRKLTRGPKTDHRVRWLACSRYEQRPPEEPASPSRPSRNDLQRVPATWIPQQYRCPCCGEWLWMWKHEWKARKGPSYCEGCSLDRFGDGRNKCLYCQEYPQNQRHWDDPKPPLPHMIHVYIR